MTRKANPLTAAIKNSLQEAKQDSKSCLERAKKLKEVSKKIKTDYSAVFKYMDFAVHSLHISASYYKPTIYLSMNKLDGFKDPALMSVLEFFTGKTAQITTRDWPQYLNRDYSFELEDVIVSISAFVRTDSPTCRKVQTGVKVEEVPQFELVCD